MIRTITHSRVARASIAFATMFGATTAHATDTAAAQALFSDARALMNDGKFSEACPKLEESENLDPGMGTLYNLGDCYEHVGRTASAWAAFDEVANEARAAGQPAREQDARKRATTLAPALAHMSIDASAVRTLDGIAIVRDGTTVGTPQWGLSIPVDPGDHMISASATGKKNWTTKITVAASETKVVAVPLLEDAPVVGPQGGAAVPRDTSNEEPRDGHTQRILGLAVAGAGVVALGVGVVFTFVSKGEESKSNDGDCNATTNVCATQNGVDARNTAITEGTISTISLLAGLVLAGGGVALWATAPKARANPTTGNWSVAPDVAFGSNGASLGMRGHW